MFASPAPRRRSTLTAAGLSLALGLVYLASLAPGLTWANRGEDGGDLIAAAISGGVPHPSGYPTYLLLARAFQALPFGSLAFRTNLFSAVCTVLAAALLAGLVTRVAQGPLALRRAAGVIAAFAFGLARLVWSQAVITEVYALHGLFVALLLYLSPLARPASLARPAQPGRAARRAALAGLVAGLALGNHLTTALLLPALLLLELWGEPAGRGAGRAWTGLRWRSFALQIGGLVIGLLAYLTLPLRARGGAPVVWGDPAGWQGLWWLVSGQLYESRVFHLPLAYLLPRLRAWAGLLLAQLGLLGTGLALYGLSTGRARTTRALWVTGWMAVAYSAFSIGYDSLDSYVYLIPVYMALAIWLGLGAAALLEALRARGAGLVPAGAALLLLVVFVGAASSLPAVDASHDARAETYGRTVLSTAPAGALLFTREDTDTFALWYFHFALRQRPDVAVLSEGLLAFDWYRAGLRRTYPALTVPSTALDWKAAVTAANPRRPACDTFPDSPRPLACREP